MNIDKKTIRNLFLVAAGCICFYFILNETALPTSGTARFSSPLSVDDFIKKTQFSYYTEEALEKVCRDVEFFANKEGLGAHARSAVIRFEDKNS